MNTIGDRLRHARETAHDRVGRNFKITQSELGDVIGIKQSNVAMLERNLNKRGDVGISKLLKAAEFLQVSFMWLATGDGDINNIDTDILGELQKRRGCPLFFPQYAKSRQESEIQQSMNLSRETAGNVSENAFFTLVSDNGLAPVCETGDVVLIDPAASPLVEDYVLVSVPGYRMPIVRQIIESGPDRFALKAINRNISDQPLDDISQLIGVVVEFRHCPAEKNRILDWQQENRKRVVNLFK